MSKGKRGAAQIRRAEVADAAEIARLAIELGYPNTEEAIAYRLGVLIAAPSHFIAVAPATGPSLLGWVAAEKRCLGYVRRKTQHSYAKQLADESAKGGRP